MNVSSSLTHHNALQNLNADMFKTGILCKSLHDFSKSKQILNARLRFLFSQLHTQAIFADNEPSEHPNSFPDIRWRLV